MERIALILGATGGIGGEMAQGLLKRGWTVRALHRTRTGEDAAGIRWIPGDALDRAAVTEAAEGARLIVHAVNPPGYRNWGTTVLPMLDNTIAAATAEGARIVLPGTVYNYGPDAFPLIGEDAPQNPTSRKGAIRVEMERRLKRASTEGARVLIVRAGDFFGPRAGNGWFGQAMVKAGQPIRAMTNPGRPGVGHQWVYLPDLAETMLRLVERDEALPAFARFHMEGVWDETGTGLIEAVRRVTAKPDLPVRRFPWLLVRLASPFVPFFREVLEVGHLWRRPIRLTNRRLIDALGEEPRTPLDEAVRTTLLALGCLPVRQ